MIDQFRNPVFRIIQGTAKTSLKKKIIYIVESNIIYINIKLLINLKESVANLSDFVGNCHFLRDLGY